MVFWRTPWEHVARCIKSHPSSPTGSNATEATDLVEVQQFLHAHFRMHPDVICTIPLEELTHDVILVVRDQATLVACIRYHLAGIYEGKQIHTVDYFCVHPTWRGKGVGDYLLHELHHRMDKKPYAIFLKEGTPLPALPLYGSTYVYREVHPIPTPHVIDISEDLAYKIMKIHQQFRPFVMIYTTTSNQRWRLYKQGIHHVLCCVQDTYQVLHSKRMGWITAWIESPGLPDTMRADASYQLSSVYDMIWMDKNHIGDSTEWTEDGSFYWYTYQWTPSSTIGQSYCFIH